MVGRLRGFKFRHSSARKTDEKRDFAEKRDLWLSEKRWRNVVGVKKMRLATLNKMSYCAKLYDARDARTSCLKKGRRMAEWVVEKCQTEGRDFDSTSVQTLLLIFVSDVEHPATHVEVAQWVKR